MNRSDLRTLVIAIAVGLLACTVPVAAQETGVPPANGGVTQEPTATALPTVKELEQRLAALSEAGGLAEDVVAKIREQYTQAIRFLGEAEAEAKRAADLRALADSAPQRFEAARAELATPAVDPVIPPPAEATLSDLQQSLRTAQAESDQARAAVAALEAETQQRPTRRVEIPQQIAAARQRLDELRAAPDATVPNGPADLTSARRISRRAEQAAATARIDALTAELASYDARAELLTAQRDLAARRLTTAERTAAAWQALVTQRQEQELNRQREESEKARREAARSHPQLAAIGRENEAIVAERAALSEKRKALDAAKTRVTDQRSRLDTKLTEVKTKAEATATPTESLALLLRRMRDELPNPRRLQADMAQLHGEIERTQFRLIELDQQRADLADPAAAAERRFAQLDPPVPPAQADQVRQALAELLRTQRDYLTDLYTDCDRYFNTLVEVSSATQALFETVDEFADYINERMLWIRSAEPLGPQALRPAAEAIGWLTDPAHWAALAKQVRADLAAHPVVNSLCLLLLVAVVIASWRARPWLRRIADQVSTADDRFALTPAALLPTILLALPLPAVLGLVAWRLWAASFGDGLGGALAMGLRSAAAIVLTFQFVRQVVRPRGLGELHFRWRTARLKPLRQYLPWLSAIVAPLMFIVMAMEHSSSHEYTTSLGRIAHILANVVASFGFLIIVRGSVRGAGETPSRSPENRMRLMNLLRYPLLVALPLYLAGISAAGYHYSALQLNVRLVWTIWLLIVVVLIDAVVRRWLYVQRRTLVLEQRRRRREEAEAARAAAAETAGAEADADEVPVIETESTELDAYTINVQTRKLLATALTVVSVIGLWVIWAEVLPALGYFDQLSLWADGETVVSVADLALAIIIGVLTVVAARNIPGLLEVVALQRLPLEPGVRFAITTVVRYTATIIGIILAFGAVGIGWSKVQWLAAAVTVGLGFGLQEIFANFVSGLIILFEQPVRVGDIVTVGDTTGVVTRIRIRATTITDWDRKEYIVPNKEFVTGRMLNWSLSDKITRVTVNVGVAYGSDTDRAREILSQVARDNPSVLEDPAPLITFEGFGDSTLNLILRAYLPNMDNRLAVISELHTAIDKAFRNAGIEIAFPQRDLHIRSVQAPLEVKGRSSVVGGAPQE